MHYLKYIQNLSHSTWVYRRCNSQGKKGTPIITSLTHTHPKMEREIERTTCHSAAMPKTVHFYYYYFPANVLGPQQKDYRARPPTPSIAFLCLPSQLFGASALRCRMTLFICNRPARSWYAEATSLSSRSRFCVYESSADVGALF